MRSRQRHGVSEYLLVARTPEDRQFQAFRRALSDAGYSEGRNLVIEWRFSGGDYARMPELVADLVHRKIEVLVVDTTLATQAAKRATSTIPIVMTSIADPVGSGLVASLAHPGGNVTGLSTMTIELVGQKLQLLKDMSRNLPASPP
jgi:putative ABC transport system substrate-binding protein